MKTIDCTPTTEGFFKMFMMLLTDGDNSGRLLARKNLLTYAKRYDVLTEIAKEQDQCKREYLQRVLNKIVFD